MSDNEQQNEAADSGTPAGSAPRRLRVGAVHAVIALTLVACVSAIAFRDPVRTRYWAWRLSRATAPAEQSLYLAALCNSGAQGRWAVSALLADRRPEIRQFGVIVLQNVRTDWARELLLERLQDDDPAVQRLAAVGLALTHDATVVPFLERMYVAGDDAAAPAACMALERLGGADAIAALTRLAGVPATPEKRAALIDALEGIGTRACVAPLVLLLEDDRPCSAPSRAEFVLDGLPPELRNRIAHGGAVSNSTSLPTMPVQSASMPATLTETPPRTIAERAAASLSRITGIAATWPPGDADARAAAVSRWNAAAQVTSEAQR